MSWVGLMVCLWFRSGAAYAVILAKSMLTAKLILPVIGNWMMGVTATQVTKNWLLNC